MDGVAVKSLTVDFHEGGFLTKLNQESKLGFWSQLSDDEKKQAGSPWGPSNPQALNRYSYVQNNPMRWVDPTGHYGGYWEGTYTVDQAGHLYNGIAGSKDFLGWLTAAGVGVTTGLTALIPAAGVSAVPALISANITAAAADAMGELSLVQEHLDLMQSAAGDGGSVTVKLDGTKVVITSFNAGGEKVGVAESIMINPLARAGLLRAMRSRQGKLEYHEE